MGVVCVFSTAADVFPTYRIKQIKHSQVHAVGDEIRGYYFCNPIPGTFAL